LVRKKCAKANGGREDSGRKHWRGEKFLKIIGLEKKKRKLL